MSSLLISLLSLGSFLSGAFIGYMISRRVHLEIIGTWTKMALRYRGLADELLNKVADFENVIMDEQEIDTDESLQDD